MRIPEPWQIACCVMLAMTLGVVPLAARAENAAFRIQRIKFDGNRNVKTTALTALARPYEGRAATLVELQVLTREVERLYRSRGFVLARASVPPQDVDGGTIRIRIAEGVWGRVTVEGEKFYRERFIRRFFAPAIEGGIVRGRPLQRTLLLLNEFTDLQVQAVLGPGERSGTTDVVLKVEDARPVHVGLDYNNFGQRISGRNRAGVSVSGGNVARQGDEASARVVDAYQSDSDPFVQLTYGAPVGVRGDRLSLQYANAATTLGSNLAVLDFRGDATIWTIGWQHPSRRSHVETTNLIASLVGKSVENTVFGGQPLSADEIRMVTVGYTGNARDRNGRTIYAGILSEGLGTLLGGSPEDNPLASRVGAGNDFTRANVELLRTHILSMRNTLFFRGSFQLADGSLPVSEMYGLGGPDSVRGFVQSEFLGDDGYALTAEFRHLDYEKGNRRLQLLAFADHGAASVHRAAAGARRSSRMTGAGVGLRGGWGKYASLRLDVGFPISAGASAEGDDATVYGQIVTRY